MEAIAPTQLSDDYSQQTRPEISWAQKPTSPAVTKFLEGIDQGPFAHESVSIAGHQKGFADLSNKDSWHGVKEIGSASADFRAALSAKDPEAFAEVATDFFMGNYKAAIEHYKKHGIYPPTQETLTPEYLAENGQMFHVLEIDADIIEKLFNDYPIDDSTIELAKNISETTGSDYDEVLEDLISDSIERRTLERKIFSIALNQMVEHAATKDIEVTVYINQFARPGEEEEESHLEPEKRYIEANKQLQTLVGQEFIENGTLTIEPIPATTLQDWKDSIDEVRNNDQNMLRFDVVWSQIMDENWNFNPDELAKLESILKYAQEHNGKKEVDIMLCLSHFTLPKRYEDHWATEGIADDFTKYAEVLLDHLATKGLLPESILTLNEPLNSLAAGFLHGGFPPFRRFTDNPQNLLDLFKAFDNTADAHMKIYEMIKGKSYGKDISVGFSNNLPVYSPYNNIFPLDHPISYLIADYTEIWLDRLLSKSTDKFYFDFIGLQYYSKFHVGLFGSNLGMNHKRMQAPEWMNPLPNGWTRFPEGMIIQILKLNTLILEKARQNDIVELPSIKITEMGVPTQVDPAKEIRLTKSSAKVGRHLSVLKVDTISKWNPGIDFDEIGVGKRTDSGFGDRRKKGKYTDKKPTSQIEPDPLNVGHPEIHFWSNRLKQAIQDFQEFRIDQVERGKIDQDTFKSEMTFLKAQLQSNIDYGEAYKLNGFEGAFGAVAEATDTLFNRRSLTLRLAGQMIDLLGQPEKHPRIAFVLETILNAAGNHLQKK